MTAEELAARAGATIYRLRLQPGVTRWALVASHLTPGAAAASALIFTRRASLVAALRQTIGRAYDNPYL